MDLDKINGKYLRWGKPLIWIAAIVMLLAVYLFGFSAFLVYLGERSPDIVTDQLRVKLIGFPATPIDWLYEQSPAYGAYINWLRKIF